MSDSKIQANLDGSTNTLYVLVIDTKKKYEILVPNPVNSNSRVSNISVRNGIIRIRLDLT